MCLFNLTNSAVHSPIVGYAFDGYPIYGPYGYSNASDASSPIKLIKPGYALRSITNRTTYSNGTLQPSSLWGPLVNSTYPISSFMEDYAWAAGNGDLDACNGRWTVTPEYPLGIYAYYTTTNASMYPQYPFVMGCYFGINLTPNGKNVAVPSTGIASYFSYNSTGTTTVGNSTMGGVTTLFSNSTMNGATTLVGNGTMSGVTTVASGMTMSGVTQIAGNGTMSGFTTLVGNGTMSGVTTVASGMTMSGVTQIAGNGTMSGFTTLAGNGTMSGVTTVASGMTMSGVTQIAGNGTIGAVITISGGSTVGGGTTVVGGITPLNGNSTTGYSTTNSACFQKIQKIFLISQLIIYLL